MAGEAAVGESVLGIGQPGIRRANSSPTFAECIIMESFDDITVFARNHGGNAAFSGNEIFLLSYTVLVTSASTALIDIF